MPKAGQKGDALGLADGRFSGFLRGGSGLDAGVLAQPFQGLGQRPSLGFLHEGDYVHRSGLAVGAEAGGDLFFLTELQTRCPVIMKRTKGFIVPAYAYADLLGYLRDFHLAF